MRELKDKPLEEMVPIGRIVKPHGLRGEMKAKVALEDETAFKEFQEVLLYDEKTGSRFVTLIDGARKANKGWILHFEGIDSMGQAERLVGFHMYVEERILPELKEGEYYYFQILGSRVFDEHRSLIGTVKDIIETGANDVMVVVREEKDLTVREELIPIIRDYILELNVEDKTIVARSMEFEEVKPE
ncbi:MAG: 16S rRNA processing protein RimM [Kosmotogaceae bacterium]|nr:16S rRNA processing protein RimM [Kosmotogaceae bacterium]